MRGSRFVPRRGEGARRSIGSGLRLRKWGWVDGQLQTLYLADYDRLSCWQIGRRNCIPEFAVYEDFSLRRKSTLGEADFSNQSLNPGYNFVGPRFQGDAHQEDGDDSEWNADGECGQ